MKSQKNKKKSWIIFGILFAIILGVMGFGYFSNFIDSNVVNDMQKDFNAEILITDDFKIIYEGEKKGRPSKLVHLEGEDVKIKERQKNLLTVYF